MKRFNIYLFIKGILFASGIYGNGILLFTLVLLRIDYSKGFTKSYWITIFFLTVIILIIDIFHGLLKNIDRKHIILLLIVPFYVLISYLITITRIGNNLVTTNSLYLFGAISITSYIIGVITAKKNEYILILFKVLKYINIFLTIVLVISFIIEISKGLYIFQTVAGIENHLLIGYTSLKLFIYNVFFITKKISIYSRKHITNILCTISLIIVQGILIMVSGSRGAFIIMNMFIIYALFLRKNIWLNLLSILLILIVLISLFQYINLNFISYIEDIPWLNRLTMLFYDKNRFLLYQVAYNNFLDNPIFGTGIGLYEGYPHNLIIELLSEWGIIGSIFFFYVFIIVGLKLFKLYKENIHFGFLFWLYIAILFSSQFSGTFKHSETLWLLMGFTLSINLKSEKSIYTTMK